MKVTKKDGVWAVSLDRGDDLRSCIEAFAEEQKIFAGKVEGIGALEDPELAAYGLHKKEYLRRTFPGIFELDSMEGNIALKDGKPFLHVHVGISGEDFIMFGGHLMNAKIGVVGEIWITPFSTPLHRVYCEDIGLARWDP